jgi:hypothetical protein
LHFIAFLLTCFSKICLGGAVSYPPFPLTPPPLCASMSPPTPLPTSHPPMFKAKVSYSKTTLASTMPSISEFLEMQFGSTQSKTITVRGKLIALIKYFNYILTKSELSASSSSSVRGSTSSSSPSPKPISFSSREVKSLIKDIHSND